MIFKITRYSSTDLIQKFNLVTQGPLSYLPYKRFFNESLSLSFAKTTNLDDHLLILMP